MKVLFLHAEVEHQKNNDVGNKNDENDEKNNDVGNKEKFAEAMSINK